MSWWVPSVPSSATRPATRAPGTVSCMRFWQRSSVLLPHPDGPMTAVTSWSATARETSRTACADPKYALSASTASRGRDGAVTRTSSVVATARGRAPCEGSGTGGKARRSGFGIVMPVPTSVGGRAEARPGGETGEEADDENEGEEDEGAGPGLPVRDVVRADGIGEDLERQRRDGLVEPHRPEVVAERGEEQRRGLARHARHGHEGAGDYPRH